MATDIRTSLTVDLQQRYNTQRVGSAFDVKERLRYPTGRAPIDGNEHFYSVNDFIVKWPVQQTEMLDAIESNTSSSPKSKQLSMYMRGFDNRRYTSGTRIS